MKRTCTRCGHVVPQKRAKHPVLFPDAPTYHKYRELVFLRIPLTGNGFRRRALVRPIEKGSLPQGNRIAFIRDPIERFVAAWYVRFHSWDIDKLINAMVAVKDKRNLDSHLRPQTTFLDQIGEINFLGRFERLFEDWEDLKSDFPYLPELKRTTERLIGHPMPYHVLEPEHVERLKVFYNDDIGLRDG